MLQKIQKNSFHNAFAGKFVPEQLMGGWRMKCIAAEKKRESLGQIRNPSTWITLIILVRNRNGAFKEGQANDA